ncbi:tyrosine-type recombinase/integrase [Bifidobacterium vansinderenii]|uniref:Site-specific recombinase phage integrase family n=1 Tax=Bifidobacterium vansinderenii TaxID=1984871 RepID=A0A229W0R4_9BIFI|nr:site-specific integrase [Bifidobacterium vansinderenii]OXN01435.1 site-specific recombinase phage integrase family [Bifidobacterium vansinderenii]
MARTRRSFGAIRTVTKKGRQYLEGSYPTPPDALAGDHSLPKRITKTVAPDRSGELEEWLRQAQLSIELGTWESPAKKKIQRQRDSITFHDYAERWIDERLKADGSPIAETTKNKYREHLRIHLDPTFGNKPMTSISVTDVENWYRTFPIGEDGTNTTARRRAYATLHAILRTASEQPINPQGDTLLDRNPARLRPKNPKRRREPKVLEPETIHAIADMMPERLALAVEIAGQLDPREGEICGLQRQDIDLENHVLHIRRAVKQVYDRPGSPRRLIVGDPKSEQGKRDIPIFDNLIEPLERHLRRFVGPKPDDFIFTPQRGGGILSPQSLRNVFGKAVRKAKQDDITFHDLRHTALTRMAEHGASPGELMAWGGHADIKTVSIYQQHSASHAKQVVQRVDRTITASLDESAADNMVNPANTDADPIITALAGMDDEARTLVLKSMPAEQAVGLITRLPRELQVRAMTALLS